MPPRHTNGMSMDHRQAQSTNAVERYLLGEMNEPERFEFESHFFECEDCAGDVRAVHALAKGVRVVCAEEPVPVREHTPSSVSSARAAPRSGWFGWMTPAFAAGLAVVAAYQGLIIIPGLRSQTGSRAMAPVPLRAAARGDEQTVEILRDQPITLLQLDVNNADPGAPLTYEMTGPGAARIASSTKAPPLGLPLVVILNNTDFSGPGYWTLVLRDNKGTEVSRYPFSVQIK
jgi:hypothetical protein